MDCHWIFHFFLVVFVSFRLLSVVLRFFFSFLEKGGGVGAAVFCNGGIGFDFCFVGLRVTLFMVAENLSFEV